MKNKMIESIANMPISSILPALYRRIEFEDEDACDYNCFETMEEGISEHILIKKETPVLSACLLYASTGTGYADFIRAVDEIRTEAASDPLMLETLSSLDFSCVSGEMFSLWSSIAQFSSSPMLISINSKSEIYYMPAPAEPSQVRFLPDWTICLYYSKRGEVYLLARVPYDANVQTKAVTSTAKPKKYSSMDAFANAYRFLVRRARVIRHSSMGWTMCMQ